jgi:OOP family OmpA-OmpF porin
MLVDQWGRSVDEDHDGITDARDHCPGTQADLAVDSLGCPSIKDKLVGLDRVMFRIPFETAQATLLPAAAQHLDSLGAALVEIESEVSPQVPRIEIDGHCDDRGSDDFNMNLSRDRANSVLEYLVANYPQLKREQFVTKGFGKTVPVCRDSNDRCREQNRRVDFVIVNRSEFREYLKRGEATPKTPAN